MNIIFEILIAFVLCCSAIFGAWLAGAQISAIVFLGAFVFSVILCGLTHFFSARIL